MLILGIESTCDETAASVVRENDKGHLLFKAGPCEDLDKVTGNVIFPLLGRHNRDGSLYGPFSNCRIAGNEENPCGELFNNLLCNLPYVFITRCFFGIEDQVKKRGFDFVFILKGVPKGIEL